LGGAQTYFFAMSNINVSYFKNQMHAITWNYMHSYVFGKDIPKERVWTDRKSILSTFRTIIAKAGDAHLLYTPDYEAEPLKGVKVNWERFCIELTYSQTAVVWPEKLLFYSFGESTRFNYFRLVCSPMQQTGLLPLEFYERNLGFSEPLVQTSIVRYQTPDDFSQKRTLDIFRNPNGVKRFYKGGDFVLFSAASPFHELWKEDMGMHQREGDKGFQAIIQDEADR
jgi:hypothetical protein